MEIPTFTLKALLTFHSQQAVLAYQAEVASRPQVEMTTRDMVDALSVFTLQMDYPSLKDFQHVLI